MQTDTEATGQDVRHQAEDTASALVDQAQQTATTKLSSQKDKAASTLESVALSLRESGESLRQDQPQIASLTDQAARRVEDISSYVREHDIKDFVGEAERLARREPLLFLGGAFALGFVAARFLKASGATGDSGRSQFDSGRGATSGGYRWSPGTGFGAGASGYAGAAAGYTPSDTAYAGTTGEFGERNDYADSAEAAALPEYGHTEPTDSLTDGEHGIRSGNR